MGDSENSNASNVVSAAEAEDQASNEDGANVDHTAEDAADDLNNQVLLQSNKDDAAMQRDVAEESKKTKQLSHRIHGTALPR